MARIETLELAHVPQSFTLYGALYKDVKNAAFLRDQLLASNSDFEYAFIDAATILSTTHILAAAFRAVNDLLNNRLKSRNVHSEIVFSLSPNNNISTSLTNHGINPTTTSILILKLSTPTHPITPTALTNHLTKHIDGSAVLFSDASITSMTDLARVRKLYKLDAGKQQGKGKKRRAGDGDGVAVGENGVEKREEVGRDEMEIWILGMMALKGS